ncbi:MAG: NUDIX domain-containing protein [Lachnospiraceae bacterium]|nr:NUDIX domain-containing protein [Lachnospiraceae bacterium]
MRILKEYDYKNYDPNGTVGSRPSVRGIIIRDGKLAVVHSKKYDYYSFPGGGIDAGESMEETLVREIREETGLTVLPESIREYGLVVRKEKGAIDDLFIQENYYFLCDVSDQVTRQELGGYEIEEDYELCWMDPDEMIRANAENDHGKYSKEEWLKHLFMRDEMLIGKLKEEHLIV